MSRLKRKWRFRRDASADRRDVILSLLIAAAAHLLFFSVFRYREPEEKVHNSGSRATLYNISNMQTEQQTRTLKWLNMHDPKMTVRGDSPAGFSAMIPKDKRRRITVSEFKPKMDMPQAYEVKYTPVAHKPASVEKLPEIAALPAVRRSGTEAINSSGKTLNIDFSRIRSFVPGSSTYFIRGSGLLRRVEIIRGTAPEQDELASQILLDSDLEENEKVTVIWMGEEK